MQSDRGGTTRADGDGDGDQKQVLDFGRLTEWDWRGAMTME